MTPTVFECVLPQLTAAYERGMLVPFIGSGMSIGVCPDWQAMIEGLEDRAGINVHEGADPARDHDTPEQLVRRANHAVRILRYRGGDTLSKTLRRLLGQTPSEPPDQMKALALRYWPLTLTTNYDDCFAKAFKDSHGSRENPLRIYGRSPADCQTVLSSLTSPSGPLLWALQGYLDRPCRANAMHPLSGEVVVGHEEYAKVTHRETHFRRAFAEVFRQRSLMFVGSGLSDPYLQGLMTEIQELHGCGTHRHYAFLKEDPKKKIDDRFMSEQFNIQVIPYKDHGDLPDLLEAFDAACRNRSMTRAMAYTLRGTDDWRRDNSANDLIIERSKLPTHLADAECAAISVGGGGNRWYISTPVQETFLRQPGIEDLIAGTHWHNREYEEPDRSYVRRKGETPVFQVRARAVTEDPASGEWGDRDIRAIHQATTSLLSVVDETTEYKTVRMQLLSAGKRGSVFPKRVSLIQSVRAFGAWKRETDSDLRLIIHLVAPEVWLELTSGRINVSELLTVSNIRLWTEVVPINGVPERRALDLPGDTPLGTVLDLLAVGQDGWTVEVLPTPVAHASIAPVDQILEETIADIGLIPDSTLRLVQIP